MTTKEIIQNVPRGAVLIVHASFKPCKAEGLTPEEVIRLLMDQLGEEGTLLMPTFSYNYTGIWGKKPYDAATTPGVENGILSETFRQTPGVIRSNNPTYSVAVWGKYARHIAYDARDWAGLGHNSSYELALKKGAKILLLHVKNNRNSMLHYAEVASGVPYNDIQFRECWGHTAITKDGEMVLQEEFPACSEEFLKFDEPFVQEGFSKPLGDSFLIDAPKMVEYIVEEMRKQPDIMLCRRGACEPCQLRRKRLRQKGLI